MDENTPLIVKRTSRTSNARLYLAVFSAVLGNFNFGYSLVYPSPSIFTLGAAAGGLGAMLLNDLIGRKLSIMVSAVPSTVHCDGRGTGYLDATPGQVYISEISHPKVRGALGSCPQITAVFGALSLYSLGLVVPWRWLAVAGEIPALLMLLLLCFMPDSPRYLITCGKQEQACKALECLRGPDSDFMAEFNMIELSISSQGRIRWSDLITPFYYKPILISIVMRFLQQMTGITPILEPKYDAALVGAIRLLSVVIAASLMDKAGRKALLYTSGFLMFLATLTMNMYSHTTPCPSGNLTGTVLPTDLIAQQGEAAFNTITLIPLISTMVFIFGYAMGWGPITWLLMSEILPLGARGVASGLCVGVSWLTAFVLTHVFIHVVETYGLFVPFLFFSVVCVVNIIFTAVCVPETRNRSLEEIENYFRTGRSFTIIDT
ncbi:unnamed protein product [Coregonus sp. 'balchen']|nr:unnamed protein product [Coregonus sp. 'balchen']